LTIVVGISDAKISGREDDVLVTYSLGSCIGVCMYDSTARLAGLLHFQLPSAAMDSDRARQNPLMFADTGLEFLLQEMIRQGADKRRLKVKLAGGAQMLNDAALFNIGKRNHAAIRKALWQHGLFVDAEDIGGSQPRTLHLNVADGSVIVRTNGQQQLL